MPTGWTTPAGVEDGQVGLLLEIRPMPYAWPGHKQHDYIVLLNGGRHVFKKRLLDQVYD
jgi:hypothetical protein